MSGPGGSQPAPTDAAVCQAAQPPASGGAAQRRVSLSLLLRDSGLLRDGSLAAAGLGGLGMSGGTLGSQDLAGLLDSKLQHMQTLPRTATGGGLDLESLLASPKWKTFLSADDEAPPGSSPPGDAAMALDAPAGGAGSGSSQALSSGTAMAAFGSCLEAGSEGPVSPGVDQQMGAAALEAAWREVQAAHACARGGGGGGAAAAAAAASVMVPQALPQALFRAEPGEQAEQQPPPHRPRGFGGKKRPAPCQPAEGGAGDGEEEGQAAPRAKHHRSSAQPPAYCPPPQCKQETQQRSHRAMTFGAQGGDAAMMDADAAAEAEAEAAGEQEAVEDLSPTDVLSGLNRVRLNSMDSSQQLLLQQQAQQQQQLLQRRVSTATMAPPAGRPGAARSGAAAGPLAGLLASSLAAGGVGGVLPVIAGSAAVADASAAVRLQPQAGALAAAAAKAAGAAAAAPVNRKVPSKSHKAVATGETGVFTSLYRGVTRHKLTGRYEAHYWDSNYVRQNVKKGGRARGRQIYLGGYETEAEAARAYDRAVIAHCGVDAPLNFPKEEYADYVAWTAGRSAEDVVAALRRGAVGFARGQSQYRGVTRHHNGNRWEARIGRVDGSKYIYLGNFATPEEAARAYDRACVKFRGSKAILNFSLSDYQARGQTDILDDPDSYDPLEGINSAADLGSGPGPAAAPARSGARPARSGGRRSRRKVRKEEEEEEEGEGEGDEEMGEEGSPGYTSFGGGGIGSGPLPFQQPGGLPGAAGMAPPGAFFLPLLQPLPLGAGVQQQLGITLSLDPATLQGYLPFPQPLPGSTGGAGVPLPAAPAAAAGGAGAPRLPAIRTRAAAAAAAAGVTPQEVQQGAGDGTPSGGLGGLDFSDLLSPLAASLLSPLGLSGTPTGWKDSPLAKLSGGELARLLSDSLAAQLAGADVAGAAAAAAAAATTASGGSSGGLVSPTNLLSPAQQRLARSVGGTPNPLGSPAGSGGVARRLSSSLARLFSSSGSEAELMNALQWLDSLDPTQLAALASLDSPRSAAPNSAGSDGAAGAPSGGAAGASGASRPPSRGKPGPSRLGPRPG